jgi:hypothetical protein
LNPFSQSSQVLVKTTKKKQVFLDCEYSWPGFLFIVIDKHHILSYFYLKCTLMLLLGCYKLIL